MEKEFFMFGRNKELEKDFILEHESCSRQHCIVQHREGGKIYLYDMGSTHGSFWNKKQIKPKTYVPLR